MISAQATWPLLLQQARIYESKMEQFYSKTGSPYLIISTANDTIRIIRVNIGTFETISIVKYKTCIARINKILRGDYTTIYEHVVEVTTILELMPLLLSKEDSGKIIQTPEILDLPEAPNVDPAIKLSVLRVIRSQQFKMKQKLLQVYNHNCSITGCAIPQLLHACHIVPFIKSGNNMSTNGLLLRSDLHDLFDANLLAVNPATLQIYIHSSITDTTYLEWHFKYLNNRVDGKRPDLAFLNFRWNLFDQH